jgi:hypothetical protein
MEVDKMKVREGNTRSILIMLTIIYNYNNAHYKNNQCRNYLNV